MRLDTLKARHLALPWSVGGFMRITVDNCGRRELAEILPTAQTETARTIVKCVNTLGPHLDDADRMAVFEAIARMGDLDLSRLMDFMKDHGLMEME